jgi:hypothetical protein
MHGSISEASIKLSRGKGVRIRRGVRIRKSKDKERGKDKEGGKNKGYKYITLSSKWQRQWNNLK